MNDAQKQLLDSCQKEADLKDKENNLLNQKSIGQTLLTEYYKEDLAKSQTENQALKAENKKLEKKVDIWKIVSLAELLALGLLFLSR